MPALDHLLRQPATERDTISDSVCNGLLQPLVRHDQVATYRVRVGSPDELSAHLAR